MLCGWTAFLLGVLLRNFLFGFYGFAAFCLATAAALAVQATTFLLRSRLQTAPATT